MLLKPKQCINAACQNVLYVPSNKLHMCLQCDPCTIKRSQSIADHFTEEDENPFHPESPEGREWEISNG